MQNFIGTEYENMTEEEVYLLHEKLIKATIRRKFPNHKAYCQVHMMELDDLFQQGSIGLLNAIRTFDSSNSSSFRSYAINRIAWSISDNTRRESLRTINTRSSETVNMVSAEMKLGSSEDELTILDTLTSENNTEVEAEEALLLEKIIEKIKQDKEIDDELLFIFTERAKGKTMQNIADHFGSHRNTIAQKLRTKKAKRIKERLRVCLENGEI